MAKFVTQDREAAGEALAVVLVRQPTTDVLLEKLWPVGTVATSGAINLLKRLTRSQDEQAARRWLNVLNQAGLVAYNRANPKMRVPRRTQPTSSRPRSRRSGNSESASTSSRARRPTETFLRFGS